MIRKTTILLALAVAILLSTGCGTLFRAMLGSRTSDPTLGNSAIYAGDTVNGLLSPRDPVGQRGYEDYFVFQAERGMDIEINAAFDDFDGYLYLYSPSGAVESNDDSSDTRHSQIATRAVESGTFTIVVTTFGSDVTGRYTLNLYLGAPQATAYEITTGQVLQGALNSSDSVGERGFEDYYYCSVQAGQQITVAAAFDGFDGYLFLVGPSDQRWEDDDYGDIYHSLLEIEAPETGRYMIIVSSFGSGATGSYSLAMQSGFAGDNTRGGAIEFGQTVVAALSSSDSSGARGYEDVYFLNAQRGDSVSVYMVSDEFDAFLIVDGPRAGQWYDDDTDGTNPVISFVANETGTYIIHATSFSSGATGNYAVVAYSGGQIYSPKGE